MRIEFEILNEIKEKFGDYSINFIRDRCYLRFGYWQNIDMPKLQELFHDEILVEQSELYDDDCGYLYSYTLTDKYGL